MSPRPPPPSALPLAREWLRHTHADLQALLPAADRGALITDDLVDFPGERLYQRFGHNPRWIGSVFGNFWGIVHTSRALQGDPGPDQDFSAEPPPWPHFRSTWVPAAEGVRLFARVSEQPGPEPRDAVVIAVGLFGDLAGPRYRDLAAALYQRGYHVLALELRGHGRTGHAAPGVPMSFGVLDAVDLLRAAGWLRGALPVRRAALVGFSWGALDAILAAWIDGDRDLRREGDPILRRLPAPGPRPVFDGGVLALSPVVDAIGIAESFERPASFLADPARYYLQQNIRRYLASRGAPAPTHQVWPLVRFELARSSFGPEYQDMDLALRRTMGFIQIYGEEGAAKLERVRTPLLIVHGANDPIAPAHLVAEVGARVKNPQVSVLVLPRSGHIGLSALSAPYYYGLILRFLDPAQGPLRG